MKVTVKHCFTGEFNSLELDITPEQAERILKKEEKVQDIVPHLSADEREFLITGMLPGEFDALLDCSDEY